MYIYIEIRSRVWGSGLVGNEGIYYRVQGFGLMGNRGIDYNVGSRVARGALIVRSLAENIQHLLIRLGVLNCAKLHGKRRILRILQ